MSKAWTAAQGAQDYHSTMRGRLQRLCGECTFKNEPQSHFCKKDKTDCIFHNLIVAETVLSNYGPSTLKEIPIDAFTRAIRVLGYTGTLEKTRTVKI